MLHKRAAVIQSAWRMVITRRRFLRLKTCIVPIQVRVSPPRAAAPLTSPQISTFQIQAHTLLRFDAVYQPVTLSAFVPLSPSTDLDAPACAFSGVRAAHDLPSAV